MKRNINKRPAGQKITIAFLFSIIGMSIIGMLSNMLINESIIIYFIWLAIITTFMLVTSTLYYYFTHTRTTLNSNANKKSALYAISSVAIGIPLLVYLGIVEGLPPTLHFFTSTDASLTVTIKNILSPYRSKYCKGGVYIEEYSYFLNNKICGINKNVWVTLSPGNKLFLVGDISPFGFTYEQAKKANN